MKQLIDDWIKGCAVCQRTATKHLSVSLHNMQLIIQRNHTVAVDVVHLLHAVQRGSRGAPPELDEFGMEPIGPQYEEDAPLFSDDALAALDENYLLMRRGQPLPAGTRAPRLYAVVMVDCATSFMTVRLILSKTAAQLAEAVLEGWIQLFGPPVRFLMDAGSENKADAEESMRALTITTGAGSRFALAHNHEGNGLLENRMRLFRHIAANTSRRADGTDAPQILSLVVYQVNTYRPRPDIPSSHFRMLGYEPQHGPLQELVRRELDGEAPPFDLTPLRGCTGANIAIRCAEAAHTLDKLRRARNETIRDNAGGMYPLKLLVEGQEVKVVNSDPAPGLSRIAQQKDGFLLGCVLDAHLPNGNCLIRHPVAGLSVVHERFVAPAWSRENLLKDADEHTVKLLNNVPGFQLSFAELHNYAARLGFAEREAATHAEAVLEKKVHAARRKGLGDGNRPTGVRGKRETDGAPVYEVQFASPPFVTTFSRTQLSKAHPIIRSLVNRFEEQGPFVLKLKNKGQK
jgi:hypothetical protein